MAPDSSVYSRSDKPKHKHKPRPVRTTPKSCAKPPFHAQNRLSVDLALQGGGSHGAFTWGVLDRLLEEDWIDIEAISGTSAGAMNAAIMADGFAKGGREGGRSALQKPHVSARCNGARWMCCWETGRWKIHRFFKCWI